MPIPHLVIGRQIFYCCDKSWALFTPIATQPQVEVHGNNIMNKRNKSSEHVRPMLEAMARSIDAAREKRTTPEKTAWSGSSEGTTSAKADFMIGSPVAENGKPKAQPKSPASSFFRDRDTYRKAV